MHMNPKTNSTMQPFIKHNSFVHLIPSGPLYTSRKRYKCTSKIKAAVTDEDKQYMQRALSQARKGLGKTYPNPAVGCVIVKDGTVVGEGYHPKAGMPHAEVYALRAAGQNAKDATAYVTLEPCDHYGRTPPCSRALVAAGVQRVVVGVGDPNPLVNGGGVVTLRQAGIEVDVGCEEEACYEINEEFMKRIAGQDHHR